MTQAFPPDIMHDLLEGVIPLIIKLVLSWIQRKTYYYSRVNDELQQLSISQNDKGNKVQFFRANFTQIWNCWIRITKVVSLVSISIFKQMSIIDKQRYTYK